VFVELRVRRRRRCDGDVRSGLGPYHVRAAHVVGRADEQDLLPILALENRVPNSTFSSVFRARSSGSM
jgi:hypothetical protein